MVVINLRYKHQSFLFGIIYWWFSPCRYTNRLLQLPQPTVTNASNTPGITQSTQRSIVTLATGQSKESEVATSCSQRRVFPVPVPVKRINSPCKGFSSVLSPIFCSQSGPSQIPSPGPFAQEETSVRMNMFYQSNLGNSNFEQPYDPLGQNTNNGANQTLRKLENKLDALDDGGKISPANNDQSGSSSICNGGVSHHNSIGYGSTCGSNNNADHVVFVKAASESKSEEGFFTLNSSRSIQREAALTKFRLKRKERCYEKKVTYYGHHYCYLSAQPIVIFIYANANYTSTGAVWEQKKTRRAASQSKRTVCSTREQSSPTCRNRWWFLWWLAIQLVTVKLA